MIEAEHLCMTLRGVRAPGTTTATSALLGTLREDPSSRAEFLALARPPAMTRSLRFTGICTYAPTFTGVCTYAPTFHGRRLHAEISAPARRARADAGEPKGKPADAGEP